MKKKLSLSRRQFLAGAFIGKLQFLVFAVLFCLCNNLYANVKTIPKKETNLTATDAYTGAKAIVSPAITSFSPATGSPGTLVTVNGTGLSAPTAFTIGGQSAIVVSNTGSVLVAMVMPGATTGAVSITTADGTASGSSNFTVTATKYPSFQQGPKLVGAGYAGNAKQGGSLALSADGNTAIVGGSSDNSFQGAVWVYTRTGSTWAQQGPKLIGTGNVGSAGQGYSVSLSADGNTAMVGGSGDNSGIGAVWVYTRSGSTWTQQGSKLIGTGSVGAAQQGWSVSLSADGNTAVEGGNQDNSGQGAVWIFTRSGSNWAQQGSKLVGTGGVGSPGQGSSISISADGNTAITGGLYDSDGVGAVWVFTRNGSAWAQQGSKLVGTGVVGPGAEQGASVSLSADGNTAMVGGLNDNYSQGAAWVYTRSGGVWAQQGPKLVGTGNLAPAQQGASVSLSADGNTAITGGPFDNSDLYDNSGHGAAWVYTRSGGAWTQQGSKLVGSANMGLAGQGSSVSLSADGNTAMAGGPDDNSNLGAAWAYSVSASGFPPPLSLSYISSPQTFNVGTKITPLVPASSGVAAAGFSGSPIILGSGFSSPTGVTADANGFVYIADYGHKAVKKTSVRDGTTVAFGSGFSGPYGIVTDVSGDVYVADYNSNSVKYFPTYGSPDTFSPGFLTPTGVALIAVDDWHRTTNYLYVADFGNNAVKEIPIFGGAAVTLGSGFNHPTGVAADYSGNVFVADAGNNAVKEIPAAGGSPVILGSGFSSPHGVAVDGTGNIFVADYGNNAVKEIPAAGGPPVIIGSGFSHPVGIALDLENNVYVADLGNNAVKEIKPAGGYYISPSLPPGLSFDNTTGIISGTPLAVSYQGFYTITAYNNTESNLATVDITVNGPLPAVSYSSPQTYSTGKPITPLAPTSSNVAVAGYSNAGFWGVSGFLNPTGVALDASGNIYVCDNGNKVIVKIPAGGGAQVTIASGFSSPYGVAVDAAGNVYVADYNNSTVKEVPVGGGAPVTIGSGFSTPTSVAVDAAGNVYVADQGNDAIKKIPAGGGATVSIGTGFALPGGVCVDAAGNVYVGDGNGVEKIPAGGGAPVTLASGFGAWGVAVDASGNVFAADRYNNTIKEIPAGGGAPVKVGPSFNRPYGVVVGTGGNIYVADTFGGDIVEVNPAGGYYINAPLPAGLNLSNSTGIIGGTPTAAIPATNYTITAWNSNGSASATVNITVNPTPGPAFTYNSPQTYTANTAITPLSPANYGGAVAAAAFSGSPVTIGSGFSSPTSVAADSAGNVYIADEGHKLVKKIPAGGGAPVTLGSGFATPYGVAADRSGNVYVADYGSNSIKKIPSGGGTPVTLGSGFLTPTGVAVDAMGNVYVADYGNNAVKKIPVTGGTPVILGSGFSHPASVAVDGPGNIYVADYGNSMVKKIPVGGGVPVIIGSGFVNPHGVAVDVAGNVFVADYGNNAIKEIPAGGGAPVILGAGFSHPVGVAVDAADNVYVADLSNNAVKQIKPVGGYYISAALPAGLSFANATGIISGTPTLVGPAKDYSVTAYNSFGSNSAPIIITVNPIPPNISYSSPQIYNVGTTITPLSPTGSGVAVSGYSNSNVTIGTGFNNPSGVAVDAAGNIYVGDYGNSVVKEIRVAYRDTIILGSGFSGPRGVAVDAMGNVYVADYGNNAVMKIPYGGGTPVSLGSGFSSPTGVAVDAAGNVYVADYGNGAVKMIPVGGGGPVTLGSGFGRPYSVAVDAAGNVYVADYSNNAVKEILIGGGAVTIGSGFNLPTGVAVDNSGNVFVADNGHNEIKEILAGGGPPVTPIAIGGSGFINPVGVAIDGAGNVYTADQGSNKVKQIKPNGGYYINTALPAGLKFANSTGIISGTPVVVSPATNYTITAYNSISVSSSAIVNLTVKGQLPTVSYSGPQTYTTGTAITPLAPTSSGVGPAGFSSTVAFPGTGFNTPTGVAADAAGNVYVADYGNKAVKKIPAGGGAPVTIGSGFVGPYGVAVDAAGNVYVADYGSSAVKMIPVGGGATVTLGSGFLTPTDVAVDAAGNVYVADYSHNAVKKIPAGGGAPVSLGSGFNHPASVSVDGLGNVYVADAGNNAVKMIPVGGGAPTVIGSGFINPHGAAADGSGNVFVGDYGNNAVKMIPAGGGSPVSLAPGSFNHPAGISADGAGNIYVANSSNNNIVKIMPDGGYYINSTLPAGLSFNNATGIISGTPTVSSPATNYTVTVYNLAGLFNSATVNIKVNSSNAKLANLSISSGTLAPAFATATSSYTATVHNVTTSVTVTPSTSDPNATVKVNGTAVASGTASGNIALAVGPNTITTIVTAQDGVTTDTYTVTVTRNMPGMNSLYEPVSVNQTASPAIADDGLLVHQGVSPNGDGINDVFTIDGLTSYPNNKVTIMNRSGTVIFEAKGYDNSTRVFDGHSSKNGAMQLPGTYFYLLEYQVGNNIKHKTGFVILKY